MDCACIIVYRAGLLDESIKDILRVYQEYVIEDTYWFSIEPEWHMRPTYTEYEKQQLTEVFGYFPVQDICIFGETDRIFVAAYEIIKRFGGLLSVNIGDNRKDINSHKGIKIEIHKKKWRNPLRHKPDYWLADHVFIREYFAKVSGDNFEKFKLELFIPSV
jgi:hypothetical protein